VSIPSLLPVFPLPGVVLFPAQQLPLHIFEPRYRQMVRDVLDADRHLVIANMTGEPQSDAPSFSHHATVGRVTAHQRMPDGRFNILVEGVVRATLRECPSERLYRRVTVTPIEEPSGDDARCPDRERVGMISLAGMLMQLARRETPELSLQLAPDLDTGALAFRIADRLVTDGAERQRILEAKSVAERVTRVTESLAAALAVARGGTGAVRE